MLHIIIADPDIACRDCLSRALTNSTDIVISAVVPNGKLCLERFLLKKADFIIAAHQLTDMDAVEFVKRLKEISPQTGILILPSLDDPDAARIAVEALGVGAFDFQIKPQKPRINDETVAFFQRTLLPKIRCYSIQQYSMKVRNLNFSIKGVRLSGEPFTKVPTIVPPAFSAKQNNQRYKVVLIGISTGGPDALSRIIPLFSKEFCLPIVIVLHMPKLFTGPMAKELSRLSKLKVREAENGDTLEAGTVYLAPGGVHLCMEKQTLGDIGLLTSDGPPVNNCKPSVDLLFESAAKVMKNKVIAVIMTGMGSDGARGARVLKEAGATIFAQDEESSVVWGMPGSVVKAGDASEVIPLMEIPARIIESIGREHANT